MKLKVLIVADCVSLVTSEHELTLVTGSAKEGRYKETYEIHVYYQTYIQYTIPSSYTR